MNIVDKFLTALRGGVQEAGEKWADTHALAILEQEMREADGELQRARDSLLGVMAQLRLAQGREKALADKIGEYEGYALQALDKGEEALALEVAQTIAQLERDKADEARLVAEYQGGVSRLQDSIAETEGHLRRIRQQADTVKATEQVQRAQEAVAARFGSPQSRLHTAMESLSRIKEKQMERAMTLEVGRELAHGSDEAALVAKLAAAGIGRQQEDARAVLARLKAKAEG